MCSVVGYILSRDWKVDADTVQLLAPRLLREAQHGVVHPALHFLRRHFADTCMGFLDTLADGLHGGNGKMRVLFDELRPEVRLP